MPTREPTFVRCIRCQQPILPGMAHICITKPQPHFCWRCGKPTYPRISGMCPSCWEKERPTDPEAS